MNFTITSQLLLSWKLLSRIQWLFFFVIIFSSNFIFEDKLFSRTTNILVLLILLRTQII